MKKWFVLSIILLSIVLHVCQIIIYSTNVPYWDDYDAILNFLNRFTSNSGFFDRFDLLFSQHAEHKILLDRVVTLADYYLFGEVDFTHLMYVGNCFVLLLLAFSIKITIPTLPSNQEPWKWVLLLPIPFLLLNMQSWDNFLWGMASIQNLGVIFFSFLCFYALFHKPLDTCRFSVAMVCSSIATFTSGNGFLSLVIGLFVMLITRKKASYIIIWILSSGFLIYSYFHVYHSQPGHPNPVNTLINETDKLALHFFSLLSSGWEVFGHSTISSLIIGIALLLALLFLIYKRIFTNQPLLFSMLLFLLLSCCLISMSRAGWGIQQALESRYKILSLLLFMFTYLALLKTIENKIFTRKQTLIFFVFIALTFGNYFVALAKYQRPIIESRKKLIHGLAAYHENNKYFYLWYPRETQGRQIMTESNDLGTYTRKLSYVDIASQKIELSFQPTNNIDYGFGLENRDDYLFVDNGWAYIEGMDAVETDRAYIGVLDAEQTDRFVVLKSDSIELVYECYKHLRPDVTAAKKVGDLSGSGLSSIILKDQIPNGKYKVGILIRKKRNFWQSGYLAFEFTDMIVLKNRNGVHVGTSMFDWDPLMGETKHYIDELKATEDSVSIRGWAIIHGISSKEIKTRITFINKANERIEVLPNMELRPDVANSLRGEYENAGFYISVSKANFENSSYKIIITLTHQGKNKIIELDDELAIQR